MTKPVKSKILSIKESFFLKSSEAVFNRPDCFIFMIFKIMDSYIRHVLFGSEKLIYRRISGFA